MRSSIGSSRGPAGGQSGVLAVTGEPGVGKSALHGYAMACASGFHIARDAGVESEMNSLSLGLFQQLCVPMPGST